MRHLLIAFLLSTFTLPAATITSAGTGTQAAPLPWSATTSWVGGVRPTAADVVVIAANDWVLWDSNIAFAGMEVDGHFVSDDSGNHAMAITSTGADCSSGAGCIKLCVSSVFDTRSTTNHYLTINSADNTNPWGVEKNGCQGPGVHDAEFHPNRIVTRNCGSASMTCGPNSYMYYTDSDPGDTYTNNVYIGGYAPIQLHSGLGVNGAIRNNVFVATVGCYDVVIWDGGTASSVQSYDISGNVLFDSNCGLIETWAQPSLTATINGNGVFAGSHAATASWPIQMDTYSDNPATFVLEGNIIASNPGSGRAISMSRSAAPGSQTSQFNIVAGGWWVATSVGGTSLHDFVASQDPQQYGVQGLCSFWESGGPSACRYATIVNLGPNINGIGAFLIGNGQSLPAESATTDHITYLNSAPTADGNSGIRYGEDDSPTLAATNGQITNNLVFGAKWGITLNNAADTFASGVCAWGGAVCNNWMAGNTIPYDYGGLTTPFSHGFDNGTVAHPASVYGDITSETPVWANMPSGSITGYSHVGPYVDLTDFDRAMGGPGTNENAGRCYALNVNPLAAVAGITCTGVQANYMPKTMWRWLTTRTAPLNVNTAKAATDGTMPGAVAPLVVGSWVL